MFFKPTTLLLSLLPMSLTLAAPAPEATDPSKPLAARQSQNLIHLSNLFAACSGDCSWSFHLSGQDTPQIPGFGADCSGIGVPRGSSQFQPCQLMGQGSGFGLQINYVQAYMSLRPRGQQSALQVVISVGNPRGGSTQYYSAYQTGQYQQFANGDLDDIDILATSYAGVA